MTVQLVTVGTVEGVEVGRPPVGGVVWDRGSLLHLRGAEVDWQVPVDRAPPLAVAGRRLYAGIEDWLVCFDVRTGTEAWAEDCGAPVTALDAHADGVDLVAGDQALFFGPRGEPGAASAVGRTGGHLRRVGALRYVGAEGGIWRIAPGERPTLLYACTCTALHVRNGALQALAEGPTGTVVVEDDGVAMVWPFVEARAHLVEPWGHTEWAVAPRAGANGLWVVDRRVQTRWQARLPGRTLAMAVVGSAVAVAVDDGGPALALIHRDVSQPLLLAIEGALQLESAEREAPRLHAEGPLLYLTHAGRTVIFHVRESD
ncbi:MAG: hypothetical protein Q8P18_31285 [Pseudomonadota bacterium]|nr:hypothetical protein [Pseudomonadota bacterium]